MNWKDLKALQSQGKYPSVSIFVRTHRAMPEQEKDPIAIKNLVIEAKDRLLKEFSARDLSGLFDNLDALVESIDYTKLQEGLAIFVNESFSQMFVLPLPFQNKVFIDSVFVIRDILGALARMPRYWVLSLSEKATKLFSGVGDAIVEIIEPEKDAMGIPRDGFPLDYTKPDIETYNYTMGKSAVSHSHVDSKYLDDRLKIFFTKVDHLLARFTTGDSRPLLVAGTDKKVALFKEATKHKIAEFIQGDFTEIGNRELAKAAWVAMQRYLDVERAKKVQEFEEAINKKHHAFGFEAVWRMARAGRINDLLVEEDFSVAGAVNPENPDNVIIVGNQKAAGISDDLVNQIVDMVIEKGGGWVTICKKDQLKNYEHIAAILRY